MITDTASQRVLNLAHRLHVDRISKINGAPFRMTLEEFVEESQAEHSGDCTDEPHTCDRCLIDQAMTEASEGVAIIDNLDAHAWARKVLA